MGTFGERVRALMAERGISLRGLAKTISYDAGYLSKVVNGHRPPPPAMARVLDAALDAGGELVDLAGLTPSASGRASDDVLDLAGWLEQSNIGDGAIAYLQATARRLAYDYPRRPPLEVLRDARTLQARVTEILRGGRQRIVQTRALLEISAELFALINLLAGTSAGTTSPTRTGTPRGRARRRPIPTRPARWCCAPSPRPRGGRAATGRPPSWPAAASRCVPRPAAAGCCWPCPRPPRSSPRAISRPRTRRWSAVGGPARSMRAADEVADAWSCTRARQVTYALQVDLGARDPAAMLRSAQRADDAWADGDQWVYGTWAQIRIGAALAYVMTGEPDAASEQLDPVFGLGDEYRVVTIIGRATETGRRLAHSRYKGDRRAAELRERIRAFQAGSLEHTAIAGPEVM
jgi:transcriptional regulator with XRE-family HTH domain